MKIIFIGDIVARLGRQTVKKILPSLRQELKPDFVIANAENLAGGRGVTAATLDEMLQTGIDYFTSGNHVFFQEGWQELLTDPSFRLLRPANYPASVPGVGWRVIGEKGSKLLLINLQGRISFNQEGTTLTDPFFTLEEILTATKKEKIDAILVDFHAEATSEKLAFAFYFDGKVSAVVGTHTHVPTADARILPQGTAYVTDVGMTGALNSVLGVKKEIIWQQLRLPYRQKFVWARHGPTIIATVFIETINKNKSKSIVRYDRIKEKLDFST